MRQSYGYSKDFRPDLLQYRQLLATLDPMGMPLVSVTLEGILHALTMGTSAIPAATA
ncbi:MAG: hypothetical protein PUP93_26760 [Rhizonema sp. NSF051]|nr:hypothetical protein [Rhizonema sp. NSF051]